MKKAVKFLSIAMLIFSICFTITGFFWRIPVLNADNAIYSLVVGILCVVASIKKKPSIVLGVLAIINWPAFPFFGAGLITGILMIVTSILNKKIAAKEAAEAEVVEEVAEAEVVEEEYVEYAE